MFRKLKDRWAKRGPIGPRPQAIGTLIAAAICVVIAGLYLRSGFGYWFDFLLAIVVAAIGIPLIALVVALVLVLLRKLPPLQTGWVVGSCVIVALVWFPPQLGVVFAIAIGLAEGTLGAVVANLVSGRFGRAARWSKAVTVVLGVLAVGANVYFVWLLVHEGSLDKLQAWRPPAQTMPAKLALANPALE